MVAATFWGLSVVDILVVLMYFAIIVGITWWTIRRIHSQEDYFMGGRRFGKLIQTFAAFGQATSVETVTSTTTTVHANGAAGIWGLLASGLFNMPIFWMTSVWYRRLRLMTMADFFHERFNSQRMGAFYALCMTMWMIFNATFGLTAMSKTVAAITAKPVSDQNAALVADLVSKPASSERAAALAGAKTKLLESLAPDEADSYLKAVEREHLESKDYVLLPADQQARLDQLRAEKPPKEFSFLNEDYLIWAVAFITLFYASAGGLSAAFITDLVQGIFILVLTVLLIPFGMAKVNQVFGTSGFLGSFQVMHKHLPDAFMDLWGNPSLPEFTWYWIAAFSLLSMINVAVQANQLTACGSAKDDYTARYGFVSGIMLKRYSSVLWGLVALLTLLLYGSTIKDPDYVWGHATRDLLGPVNIGLVGLMIASMMAALMAAKSAMMLTTSALITRNLYQPLAKNKSEKHYVWAGRVFGALFMVAAALMAMQFKSVFNLLKILGMFNCVLAAAFWLGMVWRRANRAGAWTSMLVMFVTTILLPFGMPLAPGVTTSQYLLQTTNPTPIVRTYTAKELDVKERKDAIDRWDRLNAAGKSKGTRPTPIEIGQKFEKTILPEKKSLFWSEDIKPATASAPAKGQGSLKVELVAMHWLGWDLSKNSYAFNETLTFIFRILLPFVSLMLVSRFTRPESKELLDQFYGKMRTPVVGTHEDDAREMALTRANPTRHDDRKMFRNSAWEFRKWDRQDWGGVIGASLAALSVLALLLLIVKLGA